MLYTFKSKQIIKRDIETVWEFMSSPKNLSIITPPHMRFTIIKETSDLQHIYPGQIIEYRVSPVLNIPLKWVTEITHVRELEYFVDEQRFGPYALWHHKHFLREVTGGVEMIDIVHYKLPFGFLGRLAHALFVKKQLQNIFDYRQAKINELFN